MLEDATKKRISNLCHKFRNELEQTIDFWQTYSPDPDHGGYFSCLDRFGNVYDERKYVWMQGRAAWMFSKLYREFDQRPQFLKSSLSGINFLEKFSLDENGQFYFSLARDGRPIFKQARHSSSEFCLLAYLEYGFIHQDPHYLDKAQHIFEQYWDWVKHPLKVGNPILPGNPIQSDLGGLMGTVGLIGELVGAKLSPLSFEKPLQACLSDLWAHLHHDLGVFMEYASPQRAPEFSTIPESRLFNPGHSLETCWFLIVVGDAYPQFDIFPKAIHALKRSLELGWDDEYGGIRYFVDIEGKPLLEHAYFMKHWWSQAEALLACVFAFSKTTDPYWLAWIEKLDTYIDSCFRDPEHGEWFGYCDQFGSVTNLAKGGPFKGFFHVPRALLFSYLQLSRLLSSTQPCADISIPEKPLAEPKGGQSGQT